MGRAHRFFAPSGVSHLVAKGNNGGWIVRDSIDRGTFRWRLERVATEHRWEVFAWCLMTNHVHFVMRAPEGEISPGMQELLGGHARAMNQRHRRSGHLFRNRFFSREVSDDAHLAASIAYVNRNPVRHHACEEAADWRDSSFRATMGIEPARPWLIAAEALRLFAPERAEARRALAALVASGHVPVSDTIQEVERFELGVPDGAAFALLPATSG